MKTKIRAAIAAASAVAVGLSGLSSGALASAAPSQKERAQALFEYIEKNPSNYTEINSRLLALGQQPLKVKFSNRAAPVDAVTAERIWKDRKSKKPQGQRAPSKDGTVAPYSVPSDAFVVSGYLVAMVIPTWSNSMYVGEWDFRDDYVNGSDPDDVASIQWLLPSCAQIISTTYNSYKWNGVRTTDSTMTLHDGGLTTKAPVTKLQDRASGFELNVDHGHMTTTVSRLLCGQSWKGQIGAQFTYEHNQDGGSVVGISAGWGILDISYSGSPSTRQLSTNPSYYTFT